MARNCSALALCLFLVVSLGGCSGLLSQKKASVNAPVILEEDVPEKPKVEAESTATDRLPDAGASATVPPDMSGKPAPQTDPGTLPPRRFMHGSGGWQSVPRAVDTKQP